MARETFYVKFINYLGVVNDANSTLGMGWRLVAQYWVSVQTEYFNRLYTLWGGLAGNTTNNKCDNAGV